MLTEPGAFRKGCGSVLVRLPAHVPQLRLQGIDAVFPAHKVNEAAAQFSAKLPHLIFRVQTDHGLPRFQQVGDHLLCNAKYIETSVVKLSPNPTKILPERKQKQQSYSPARSARAIPCMRYSTQGTATLFPSALYLAESDAPGMSVQPGG